MATPTPKAATGAVAGPAAAAAAAPDVGPSDQPNLYGGESLLVNCPVTAGLARGTLFITNFRALFRRNGMPGLVEMPLEEVQKVLVNPATSKELKIEIFMKAPKDEKGQVIGEAKSYIFGLCGGPEKLPIRDQVKNTILERMKLAPSMVEIVRQDARTKAGGSTAKVPSQILKQREEQEKERRKAVLLQKNEKITTNDVLRTVYMDLVKSDSDKAVKDDEFWQPFSDIPKRDGMEQKVGVSSGFISNMHRVDEADGSKITITLTVEIMEDVFAMYPKVKEAFMELVPVSMTENEFWHRVVQSQAFHRKSISLTGSNDAADFFKLSDLKEDDERTRLKELNPLLNLAADVDYMDTREDDGKEEFSSHHVGEKRKRELMASFNHDSRKILKLLGAKAEHLIENKVGAVSADSLDAEHAYMRRSQDLVDLLEPPEPSIPVLQVVAPAMTAAMTPAPSTASSSGGGDVAGMDVDVKSIPRYCAPRTTLPAQLGGLTAEGAAGVLLKELKSDLESHPTVASMNQQVAATVLKHDQAMTVVLQHFWACFKPKAPDASNPALVQRVRKIGEHLKKYREDKVEACRKALGAENQVLMDNLLARMDKAIEKLGVWEKSMAPRQTAQKAGAAASGGAV